MSDVAEYIKYAQATLHGYTQQSKQSTSVLHEKVAHAVGCLIDKGLAAPDDRNDLIREMVNDPVKIADALIKVSNKSEIPTLGSASDKMDSHGLDPIARFALGDFSVIRE